MNNDPFVDAAGNTRVLRGAAVVSGSPRLCELAGQCGLDVVWIDVEHGSVPSANVESLCFACEVGGVLACVRVPDAGRQNILWALEWGARLIVVPMVNDAETARQIVAHGKFAPQGSRGYNTRSRGVNYGLGEMKTLFAEANARTQIWAQIETREAVENLDAICEVEGLSGIFIGPGDLSVAYGCTGEFTSPELIEAVAGCIRRARSAGKYAGILVMPGPMLDAALEAGANFVICGSDIGDLAQAWKKLAQA